MKSKLPILDRIPNAIWFAAGLCFLIGFVFVVGWSSAQRPHQEQSAAQSTAQVSHPSATDERVADYALALDWLTAFLVVSTVGLWLATRKSAKISERALTELEAPFISIKITGTGISRSYGKTGHDFKTIWFCITNSGRTPASLIELVDKLALLEDGKEWPREVDPGAATRSTMPYGVIAPPNGDSQPFSNNLFAFMMNALAADPLPLKTQNLFFYGFVRYSTIFDEVFRMGFCYMFDRYSEKWLLFGNEKYNYCRKESGTLKPR